MKWFKNKMPDYGSYKLLLTFFSRLANNWDLLKPKAPTVLSQYCPIIGLFICNMEEERQSNISLQFVSTITPAFLFIHYCLCYSVIRRKVRACSSSL